MAFEVKLFQFSKKENSTKRPNDADASSFNCVLKDGSGIINPNILLDIGINNAPSRYNYAYIPSFNRYYWIDEWVNDGKLWSATMNVDALATYKTQIGASNLYVLRASNEYDGNIIDSYYTSKTNISSGKTAINKPHNKINSLGKDGFIVGLISNPGGIISDLGAQYGSITYEYFTRKGLYDLVKYLMNTQNWGSLGTGFDLNDASLELQKSLVDPLQYIKSCLWVPYDMQISIIPSTLSFYGWDVPNIEHTTLSSMGIINTESVNVSIPKHPSTNSRGNYVNCSPYTRLWLNATPYGVIELDTSITANLSTITLKESLDLIDGKAILTIEGGGVVIDKQVAQMGVPIQISQVSRDYLGVVGGVAQSVMGGVEAGIGGGLMYLSGGMFGGDMVGSGLSGIVGGAVDAYKSYIPKSKSLGGGGGFVDLSETWHINHTFFLQTDDDNSHVGRPLYANRVISNLGGFIMVKDGAISLNATQQESQLVKTYLERGFYYE